MPTIYTGTSGYSYKEWKPAFYPEKLAQTKFLAYYAEKLGTVEINNTFYRFPTESLLTGWADKTPDTFRFAVKANQKITHHAQLREIGDYTSDFIERCGVLGRKLGPILFQLPPHFRRDDERLASFLDGLAKGARYAMEFRHQSWFEQPVFDTLSNHGVALCVSEGDKLDTPRVATTDFVYARLRKEGYEAAELGDWRKWFIDQTRDGRDVYAYLKHDKKGESPEHALRLLESA